MILVKTEGGQRMFKDRSVPLTPRQRSAYILCDGKRSVDEVLQAGMGLTREDIDQMVELGLLGPAGGTAPVLNGAHGVAPNSLNAGAVPAVSAPAASSAPTAPTAAASSAPATPSSAPVGAGRTAQQRYQDAYPLATQLTSSLGLRGLRLNLAVEGTSSYEQLLALFPKIEAAVGAEKAAGLKKALSGG